MGGKTCNSQFRMGGFRVSGWGGKTCNSRLRMGVSGFGGGGKTCNSQFRLGGASGFGLGGGKICNSQFRLRVSGRGGGRPATHSLGWGGFGFRGGGEDLQLTV